MADAMTAEQEFELRQAIANQALGEEATGWWLEHEDHCAVQHGDPCSCSPVLWFSASRRVARVDFELTPQLLPRH